VKLKGFAICDVFIVPLNSEKATVKQIARIGIAVGLLFLLVAWVPGTASAQGSAYVVQPGDTLAVIAQRYGTSVSAIVKINGLASPDRIYAGQRLVIPVAGSGAGSGGASRSGGTYIVKAGDTLAGIAQHYGTTIAAITRVNGITNPNRIWVGMKLIIPGASGGGSTAPIPSGRASRFVVSISQQHCWLYQGDTVIGNWACSTGRRGSPTVPGSYHIQSRFGRAYGSSWNIWMPYWLGIYWAGSTENGIHGMPYNASSGASTWPGLVGTPITYGCVMLADEHAETLYNMAWIGMSVIVQR
jgi:LysM repeat protein